MSSVVHQIGAKIAGSLKLSNLLASNARKSFRRNQVRSEKRNTIIALNLVLHFGGMRTKALELNVLRWNFFSKRN